MIIMSPSMKIVVYFVGLHNIFVATAPGPDDQDSTPALKLFRKLFHDYEDSDVLPSAPSTSSYDAYAKCLRDIALVFSGDNPKRHFLYALKSLNLQYFTSNEEAKLYFIEMKKRLDWYGQDENIYNTDMFCGIENYNNDEFSITRYFCLAALQDFHYTSSMRGIDAFNKVYDEEIYDKIHIIHNISSINNPNNQKKIQIFQSYIYYFFKTAFDIRDDAFLSMNQFCSRHKYNKVIGIQI